MDQMTRSGMERVCKAVNDADFENLAAIMNDGFLMNAASGGRVLNGILSAMLEYVSKAHEQGMVQLQGEGVPLILDPAGFVERLNYLRMGKNTDQARDHAQMLFNAVAEVRTNCPTLRMSVPDQTPDQAGPVPIPVQVVGMPTRETVTYIKRDAAGNIVKTSQIEQDCIAQ